MSTLQSYIRILIIDRDLNFASTLALSLRNLDASFLVGIIDISQIPIDKKIICDWLSDKVKSFKAHIIMIDQSLLDHDFESHKNMAKKLSPACCFIFTDAKVNTELACYALFARNVLLKRNVKPRSMKFLMEIIYRSHFKNMHAKTEIELKISKRMYEVSGLEREEIHEIIERLYSDSEYVIAEPIDSLLLNTESLRIRSMVLVVETEDKIPFVLKITSREKIEQEERNYRRHISHKLSDSCHSRIEECVCLWNIGGITYSLIGNEDRSPNSFSYYYSSYTEEQMESMGKIIDDFCSKSLSKIYKLSKSNSSKTLFEQYDEAWFPEKNHGKLSKINEWLSSFEDDNEYLQFIGIQYSLPNPVKWIKSSDTKLSGRYKGMREALTHGDLHFDNILVDSKGNNWLIDFERSGYGPRLRDFVEMESDVVNRLLIFSDNYNFLLFFKVMLLLLKPSSSIDMEPLRIGSSEFSENYSASKALFVVHRIRLLAYNVTKYEDFREYLWGLFMNSLFLAAYLQEGDFRYSRALIYASLLRRRLGDWQGHTAPQWPPPEWVS